MASAFPDYFLPLFERHARTFVLAAGAVLTFNSVVLLPLLVPATIGVIVIACALCCYMGNVGKHGDFSCSVYILYFPIIEALLAGGWLTSKPFAFLGAVICLTGLGAVMRWHLVESRFLRPAQPMPRAHLLPLHATAPAQPAPGT